MTIDVLTMGNALVDIFTKVEEHHLEHFGVNKGIMHLVDDARAAWLRDQVTPERYVSGGSAANTAVGFSTFSAKAGFIGRVKQDALGDMFTQSLLERGVQYITPPATSGDGTGSCLVMVTPDGERTMSTSLGAGQALSVDDIHAQSDMITEAKIVYFEGYLWDPLLPREAILETIETVHKTGGQTAMSLSDPFCADRFRDDFRKLIASRKVDLVFANEDEVLALYETDDFEQASRQFSAESSIGIITRGAQGCVILDGVERVDVPAMPVKQIVDLTGAGDQFAAGFLFGYTRGLPHQVSGQLGCLAASEVISHFGAQPETNYKSLAQRAGFNLGYAP